jgi:uncharacterized phage infection (PIP) family protein YhgE
LLNLYTINKLFTKPLPKIKFAKLILVSYNISMGLFGIGKEALKTMLKELLKEELSALNHRMDKLEETLSKRLDTIEQDVRNLYGILTNMMNAHVTLAGRFDRFQEIVINMQNQLNQLQLQVNQLQAQVNQLQAQVNQLQAQVNQLQAQVNQHEEQFNSFRAEVNKRFEEINSRLDRLEAQVNSILQMLSQK